MADMPLEQRIMDKLRNLDDSAKQRVLDFIEHAAEIDEVVWEERLLSDTLAEALLPDGSLNFDLLRARGKVMTPEELYPEGDEDDSV